MFMSPRSTALTCRAAALAVCLLIAPAVQAVPVIGGQSHEGKVKAVIGQELVLAVTALGGSGAFAYEWMRDGEPIPGTHVKTIDRARKPLGTSYETKLVLGPIQVSDAGIYWVEVVDMADGQKVASIPVRVIPLSRERLEEGKTDPGQGAHDPLRTQGCFQFP